MSALKAGMNRKTAAKYLKLEDPCQPPRVEHQWRTREDGFSKIWPEAEVMLKAAPELQAKSLFEHFQGRYPQQISGEQLRSFQRRVKQWKTLYGPNKEVYFEQNTIAGEVIQTDWTHMGKLGITIGGQPYSHLLCHSVLIHSNWEWATRCHSESLLSLRHGIQAALGHLGGVPKIWQLDNSSAATHQLRRDGKERNFNSDFLALAEHFGMKPRTINVGCPNENGDVESLNGHLKRRLKQHLLLRGSSDFGSLEAYDTFLAEVLNKANATRCKQVSEELEVLRELPTNMLPDYEELYLRVGWSSTLRIKKIPYSVPSRLIGSKVKVQVREIDITILHGREIVATLPRHYGEQGAVIDFRHVITGLVRKPGAFANWKHREALFPGVIFRKAYDLFIEQLGLQRGERDYLHLLKLAADNSQSEVEAALVKAMKGTLSLEIVRTHMPRTCWSVTQIAPPVVVLSQYDDLFHSLAIKELSHAS